MSKETSSPVILVGHGNPMNAIADNAYTQCLKKLGDSIPMPQAILCVSAHWQTKGTFVTHMKTPKTIHDFYGFPQQLFEMQYPAPGSPEIAELIQSVSKTVKIEFNETWGLDHGAWAVLCKMYPKADIPVLQLSIDISKPALAHFELGQTLKTLRQQGVLILGSGNTVHNLRTIDWNKPNEGFDWAIQFDNWVKDRLTNRDFISLIEDFHKTQAGQLSVPTLDHYLPLLYIVGAASESDALRFEYEGYDMGSISMLTLSFGL
ncbi:MAG: 4,5-DOPA-extradiol-dioxygenase [Pseudobdellovibrionaceae bacterium]